MMAYYDATDPYGGGYGDTGSGDSGGTTDGDTTGGTDPTNPPQWKPTPNGWWEFIGGVWKWMTEPAPHTVSKAT